MIAHSFMHSFIVTISIYTAEFPDVKSIFLNIASTVLILLPFAAYLDQERIVMWVGIVAGVFAITLLIPPLGWYRPHPYSDMESNRLKTK